MDKGVIENFYHIRTMDEYELDETNTFIVKVLSKPSGPLLYIYLDFKKKMNSLLKCIHYKKINTSPLFMYANASTNTTSYTHVSLYVVWRVHPQGTRS